MGPTWVGRRPLAHRFLCVLGVGVVALTVALAFVAPAKADANVDEAQFFADLNVVRARAGVPAGPGPEVGRRPRRPWRPGSPNGPWRGRRQPRRLRAPGPPGARGRRRRPTPRPPAWP